MWLNDRPFPHFLESVLISCFHALSSPKKAACGRAGEAEIALDLFRSMKDEGLSADRVAYNALFSALRVAGRADQVRKADVKENVSSCDFPDI